MFSLLHKQLKSYVRSARQQQQQKPVALGCVNAGTKTTNIAYAALCSSQRRTNIFTDENRNNADRMAMPATMANNDVRMRNVKLNGNKRQQKEDDLACAQAVME